MLPRERDGARLFTVDQAAVTLRNLFLGELGLFVRVVREDDEVGEILAIERDHLADLVVFAHDPEEQARLDRKSVV